MRIRIVGVAALLLTLVIGIPHASADDPPPTTRTITVHVTVNGVVEPGAGIVAFPTSVPPNQRNGSNGFYAEMTSLSDATITLNTTDDYIVYYTADNITQFFPFTFAQFNGEFGYVPASTTSLQGGHDFNLDGRTYIGQLTRTGFQTFDFHTAGLGACPSPPLVPALRADGYCNGLRFTWADANGNYRLRLGQTALFPAVPVQSWNIAGFLFIDGRPVRGPFINDVVPPGKTAPNPQPIFSLDVDPTPVPSAPPVGPAGHEVTVSGASGVLNVASVPASTTPVPSDVTFANGVVSFTSLVPAGTTTTTVRLSFFDGVPQNANWYKLRDGVDQLGAPCHLCVWVAYTNVVHDPDGHTLIVTLHDGVAGEDDDGIVNGYVTDPGALGVPTNQPVNKDQCKKDGWKNGPYKNQGDCVSHFARK